MNCSIVKYTNHAIEYMGKRTITDNEIIEVINHGEIIEHYESDKPFPSKLIFATVLDRPLHIVVAYDKKTGTCFVVTAYEPNFHKFNIDFKTRRKEI